MKQRGNALLSEPKFIDRLTPSQQAKELGCKSLKEVSDMTGVSVQTLINWHKSKPILFEVLVIGCHAKAKNPAEH